MSIRDGGPVFATMCPGNHPRGEPCVYFHKVHEGLTKREWFAGLAMQVVMDKAWLASGLKVEEMAADAVQMADAMVAALIPTEEEEHGGD